MGLKIKTFTELLNNMANWVSSTSGSITNFHVGSVVRTLLESIAVEMESLYFQMNKGLKYARESSIYNSFGFHKLPAVSSTGTVTVVFRSTVTQKTIIPQGFKFCTTPINGSAITFETSESILIPLGSTQYDLPVVCCESGVVGNVDAYSIRRVVTPIPLISEAYNSKPILNGMAEETKEERKKRFTKYINTLPRGTVDAIQYGCLQVPGVSGAYVRDGIGRVTVYAHDASGNLSASLRQQIVESLVNYRSAGVEVEVLVVVKKEVDLDVKISLNAGFDEVYYTQAVQNSVTSFLNYFTVSKSLTIAELIKHIMSIDTNAINNVKLSMPSDIMVEEYQLIRAGIITVQAKVGGI